MATGLVLLLGSFDSHSRNSIQKRDSKVGFDLLVAMANQLLTSGDPIAIPRWYSPQAALRPKRRDWL